MNAARAMAKIGRLSLLLATPVGLWGGELTGYLKLESRAFADGPAYLGQEDGASAAVVFEPEYYHAWTERSLSFVVSPYLRKDSHDSERDFFDLRELSLLWVSGYWETRIGISKVFWGVMESRHLVDTINQTDLVASPDGEEKLGQPMIHVVRVSGWGDFGLFIMPGFRERTFPGREGRLRGLLWVDTENPLYESSGEDERVDVALRWKRYIGNYDIGLHYFSGTNRDPRFVPALNGKGESALRPYYALMEQIGLDAQLTQGGWLWKLEALALETDLERYSAMSGGFEYTLYGLGGSPLDLGLLAEGHLDSRGSDAPTVFNRDLFLGGRLTWNDEADTSMVAGALVDVDNGSTLGRLEFERRLGDSYTLELEAQKLMNINDADPLYPIRRDTYLQVALSRYF